VSARSRIDHLFEAGRLVDTIRHGDRVEILVPAGMGREGQEWKKATGRAVMLGPAGWVLNMGGAHGTPGIATDENTVSVNGHRGTLRSMDTVKGNYPLK